MSGVVNASDAAPRKALWLYGGQRPAEASDLVGINSLAGAPLGWRITGVCSLVALLETTATGMVGGALSNIQETFKLSDTLAGFIPTAAVVGSLLVALLSANLADNARRVSVLAGGAVLWTLVAIGSAWAPFFVLFLVSRALLGATAQLNNPAAASLIADAHPAAARAKAYGLERLSNYIGLPLGIGLGGALSSSLGWRTAFTVMALPGAVAAFVAFRSTEPPRGLGDLLDANKLRNAMENGGLEAAKQNGAIPNSQENGPSNLEGAPTKAQLRMLLSIPTLRAILTGLPVLFLGLGALFFWSTKYFEETHGLEEKAAGGISGGVGGTGIMIGIILGSRLGDKYHGVKPGWRLRFSGLGLFVAAVSFALMLSLPGVALQAVFYGLANVGIAIAIPNLTAAVADVVQAKNRGLSFSTLQFLLALGTAIGPPLVGAGSDLFGSLRPAMGILVVPLLAAGFIVTKGSVSYDNDARNVALRAAERA
jgi:predicted MFS family arabinose efflux permease